jgi:prepilin peptidase CpaA
MVSAEVAVAGFVGLAASIEDIARRRVSNWIPVVAALGGIICQVLTHGWYGTLLALGGAACGFSVFLIFYWLGGMGGGDVKLMAGFGAVLGARRLFEAALWTAALGGIIAAGVIGYCAIRKRIRKGADLKADGDSIPYAPAIALGAWLALLPK